MHLGVQIGFKFLLELPLLKLPIVKRKFNIFLLMINGGGIYGHKKYKKKSSHSLKTKLTVPNKKNFQKIFYDPCTLTKIEEFFLSAIFGDFRSGHFLDKKF